jgi:hypothetical protein
MNMKTNTICFIILLFLLLGAVQAADSDNETLQQTIEHANNDDCSAISDSHEKLELCNADQDNVESSVKDTAILQSGKAKQEVCSLTPTGSDGKMKVSIKAPDVKMHYKDGIKFTVTLKDSANKAIKKAKIKITIDGQTYTKTTDSKGKASINLNFKSGTYSVTTAFDGTKSYGKKSVKSTVTIKSTIKCDDFSKYYKNKAVYYSKFYDKKGKLLKETSIKFKLNSKSYSAKTNKKGVAKLSIDLKPGKYSVSSINSKTSETITKTITIKTLIETKDLTMKESDGSKFTVKVLNSNGKASPNKKVTLKVNGKTYTPKSNSNGIASQAIDLKEGKYTITTEYEGLKNTNQIIVNKNPNKAIENQVKKSTYIHTTSIPNYVNVTLPYAFHNSAYTVKTGVNGTVRMPKVEVFTVEVGNQVMRFATGNLNDYDTTVMEYKSYLVPLNGNGMTSSLKKDSLYSPGIIITRTPTSTEIDYVGVNDGNIESFGFYADANTEYSEMFKYTKNDNVMAKVTVQTQYFDETGVKYNLAKLYNKADLNFKYSEITNLVNDPVVFTNTGEPVTYSYFNTFISGYQTREDITIRFIVNGIEELEKSEKISYGLAPDYRTTLGFEVLQSYSIINEKVTRKILENWVNNNRRYLNRFGIMNVYGMHLASLETAWLADEMADAYAKEFGVSWKRNQTLTILGGINLDDTYLNILNSDMGMEVSGNGKNAGLFKLINSLYLPNIEEYVLKPIGERFLENASNSLDNVLASASNFSIAQLGEMMYVFGSNDSAIVLNTTDGVCSVILSHGNTVYKGSQISTTHDCCSVGIMPQDMIKGIRDAMKFLTPGIYYLTDHFDKIHPFSTIAYNMAKYLLGSTLTGAAAFANGLVSTMVLIQATGTKYREKMIDESEWHTVMDQVTFTRPGYLQSKKIYNIPNKSGGTDYVEVDINDDLSLNRSSVKYISEGKTRQLTKEETYQYFCEDYWTPFSMPAKYWDKSWKK